MRLYSYSSILTVTAHPLLEFLAEGVGKEKSVARNDGTLP